MDYLFPTTIINTTGKTISFDDTDYLGPQYSVKEVVVTFISLLGMVLNGIVIWYLIFRIHRNSFTVYILNLALADFSFLLFFMFILCYVCPKQADYYTFSYLCGSHFIFSYALSQYLLTAISVERCVSVLFPIWYRCHRPKHQSAIVCAVLWVFAILTHVLDYFFCVDYYSCRGFSRFQSVVLFLVFLPLMLLSNVILIIEICRRSQRRQPLRMYILIITTGFAFLVLSLPLAIFMFLSNSNIAFHRYYSLFLIDCNLTINSSLNPVIYFLSGSLGSRQRKCSIVAALRRAFADKADHAAA